jgi:hypothetical protein
MSYIDDLKTARDNIAAQLAEMTGSPKPTYSKGGQTFAWGEHFNNLLKAQADINKQLATAEPFIIESQGYST